MRTIEEEIDDEFAAVLARWEHLNDEILAICCATPDKMSEVAARLQQERRDMSDDMLRFHRLLGEKAENSRS